MQSTDSFLFTCFFSFFMFPSVSLPSHYQPVVTHQGIPHPFNVANARALSEQRSMILRDCIKVISVKSLFLPRYKWLTLLFLCPFLQQETKSHHLRYIFSRGLVLCGI